ncbi:hypothetical protein [Kangiella sp.]|uniref:hypothetical protein n=1 Tax=Kangiella sp. TaxID=1920245 RepID=UPI003A94AB62
MYKAKLLSTREEIPPFLNSLKEHEVIAIVHDGIGFNIFYKLFQVEEVKAVKKVTKKTTKKKANK